MGISQLAYSEKPVAANDKESPGCRGNANSARPQW